MTFYNLSGMWWGWGQFLRGWGWKFKSCRDGDKTCPSATLYCCGTWTRCCYI